MTIRFRNLDYELLLLDGELPVANTGYFSKNLGSMTLKSSAKGDPVGTFETQDPENEYRKKEPENIIAEDVSDRTYAHDQANPFNWSKKRKWIVVATVSCMMLFKYGRRWEGWRVIHSSTDKMLVSSQQWLAHQLFRRF